MSEIRANTVSNAAGTGPATLTGQYAAKAWVNFNGTGTVAIRESGNVSSITDNGTGDYTVNFTTAMADANYSFSVANREDTGGTSALGIFQAAFRNTTSILNTSLRVLFAASVTKYDMNTASVTVTR